MISRPHSTALSLILSRFSAINIELTRPDEGGLKTYRLCSVGSEGVREWLADGYHYPKTFGGQPKSDIRGDPVSCFTARQGIHVIDHRYPPTEVRMVQCGPASGVANPHVCPYSANAGFLNTTQWIECDNEIQSQGMSKVSYQGDGSSFEGGDVCLSDRSTGCT